MNRVVAISPGKVILFGEHFVVIGSKALAMAIDLYARAEIEESSWPSEIISKETGIKGKITKNLKVLGPKELEPITRLLSVIRSWGYNLPGFKAIISSDIPISSGLGSSAAIASAFSMAYMKIIGHELDKKRLVALSNEAEKVTHGNPSGVDSAAIVYGGVSLYRKEEGVISNINGLPRDGYSFIIADTGVKRKTYSPVNDVVSLSKRFRSIVSLMLDAEDRVIELAYESLEKGDYETLGQLMNINQGLLNSLGVSSREIEEMVYEGRMAGAVGAKLTGAGRGGAVIVLCRSDIENEVINRLSSLSSWVKKINIPPRGTHLI